MPLISYMRSIDPIWSSRSFLVCPNSRSSCRKITCYVAKISWPPSSPKKSWLTLREISPHHLITTMTQWDLWALNNITISALNLEIPTEAQLPTEIRLATHSKSRYRAYIKTALANSCYKSQLRTKMRTIKKKDGSNKRSKMAKNRSLWPQRRIKEVKMNDRNQKLHLISTQKIKQSRKLKHLSKRILPIKTLHKSNMTSNEKVSTHLSRNYI